MPNPAHDPVQAVAEAIYPHTLPRTTLEAVVEAVLQCHDSKAQMTHVYPRQFWEQPEAREEYRRHTRQQLYCEVADAGLLMVGPPQERLTHHRGFNLEPVSEQEDWDMVTVVLSVKVRHPRAGT